MRFSGGSVTGVNRFQYSTKMEFQKQWMKKIYPLFFLRLTNIFPQKQASRHWRARLRHGSTKENSNTKKLLCPVGQEAVGISCATWMRTTKKNLSPKMQ